MQSEPEIIEYRGYEIKLTYISKKKVAAAYQRKARISPTYGTPPKGSWWPVYGIYMSRRLALDMAKARVDMLVDNLTHTLCPQRRFPKWQVRDYQGKRKPVAAAEGGEDLVPGLPQVEVEHLLQVSLVFYDQDAHHLAS